MDGQTEESGSKGEGEMGGVKRRAGRARERWSKMGGSVSHDRFVFHSVRLTLANPSHTNAHAHFISHTQKGFPPLPLYTQINTLPSLCAGCGPYKGGVCCHSDGSLSSSIMRGPNRCLSVRQVEVNMKCLACAGWFLLLSLHMQICTVIAESISSFFCKT